MWAEQPPTVWHLTGWCSLVWEVYIFKAQVRERGRERKQERRAFFSTPFRSKKEPFLAVATPSFHMVALIRVNKS